MLPPDFIVRCHLFNGRVNSAHCSCTTGEWTHYPLLLRLTFIRLSHGATYSFLYCLFPWCSRLYRGICSVRSSKAAFKNWCHIGPYTAGDVKAKLYTKLRDVETKKKKGQSISSQDKGSKVKAGRGKAVIVTSTCSPTDHFYTTFWNLSIVVFELLRTLAMTYLKFFKIRSVQSGYSRHLSPSMQSPTGFPGVVSNKRTSKQRTMED